MTQPESNNSNFNIQLIAKYELQLYLKYLKSLNLSEIY